ncbi:MAG: hypothetical protein KAR30_03830 [Gammaproteobacteria bacterium]|nr:hypothetical protein [Gammaproteobacteria bacterium]
MLRKKPPTTGGICAECQSPDIAARPKDHFGSVAWEFECDHVKEVFLESKGVVINCAINNCRCCVDDGRDYFVNSPKISPLKSFFEASMKFLDR